jgi:hypothetical protein
VVGDEQKSEERVREIGSSGRKRGREFGSIYRERREEKKREGHRGERVRGGRRHAIDGIHGA